MSPPGFSFRGRFAVGGFSGLPLGRRLRFGVDGGGFGLWFGGLVRCRLRLGGVGGFRGLGRFGWGGFGLRGFGLRRFGLWFVAHQNSCRFCLDRHVEEGIV